MVFDVDKLKEALRWWNVNRGFVWQRATNPEWAQLDRLADAGDMVVAGQPLWYCQTHMETSWSNEHCWASTNRFGLCRMINWWTFPLPTGKDET